MCYVGKVIEKNLKEFTTWIVVAAGRWVYGELCVSIIYFCINGVLLNSEHMLLLELEGKIII